MHIDEELWSNAVLYIEDILIATKEIKDNHFRQLGKVFHIFL